MEVSAEPLLVSVAGDADHHRVAVLPVGEELQCRGLAANLVRGVVQVGEVLDFRDGQQAGHPGAEGQPEDGLLVEQRVEYPRRTRLVDSSPRVTPYTPPLRATSSPKISASG